MNRVDLIVADAFADAMLAKLNAAWIPPLCGPFLHRPYWIEWALRRADDEMMASLNSVGLHLTPEVRIRYREELLTGQGFDDATAYWLRCWCAAFCLPFKPGWVSRSSVTATGKGAAA